MKFSSALLALPTLLGLASMPIFAAEDAAGSVSVADPYVRAVPPGQRSSAAFMTLRNGSGTELAVVSAESPASKIVELHTHINEGGMMRMRQIEKIVVPAQGRTLLKPGGLHVMLIELRQALKAGDEVPVTLVFQDGSRKTIQAPVRKIKTRMH